MQKTIQYKAHTRWATPEGTADKNYDRTHTISIPGKPDIILTTGNPITGDTRKLNPEDLIVASVSSCHMLTYLYLCAMEGVAVTEYTDDATGTLAEEGTENACIGSVTLNPVVTVSQEHMIEKAMSLHNKAHSHCIIANSVNFEITTNPICKAEESV